MISVLKKLFNSGAATEALPKDGLLIDVRTEAEFRRGHLIASTNIPLQVLNDHINDFKRSDKPIILICRSGARSGRAAKILKSHGIEAYNGGAWESYPINK